ncbi:MAG: SMP-30/gluconolactonase/LRE family protein [Bacteroidetes bacterium]|nr:SMP-30/gluconolactonase/LRE family protein [Bacteroidota bacterium]
MKNCIKVFLYVALSIVSTLVAIPQVLGPQSYKLDTLAVGLKQPEGPLWVEGVGLLFSDIMANKIYLWSPNTQSITVFLAPSDSSNGLTLDRERRLVLTQMAKRRVVRREHDGTLVPLAETFRGKKFNSPNDLVVKSDGSVFFTDPDFNVPFGQQKELTFKGIYRISTSGHITLLDSTFDKPNGICFSPDERRLYVNESAQRKIYVWDVVNDSVITNKRLFYTIPQSGYADGMKTDSFGNLYCTGPGGVWILSPEGTVLGKISTPLNPSNCTWGDVDRKTLFITAGYGQGVLYRVRVQSTSNVDRNALQPEIMELFQNYPNPCNPSTTIMYRLNQESIVTLDIFDSNGRSLTTLIRRCLQGRGVHTVPFNTQQYASGVYYYRLSVNVGTMALTQTRSFVVVK